MVGELSLSSRIIHLWVPCVDLTFSADQELLLIWVLYALGDHGFLHTTAPLLELEVTWASQCSCSLSRHFWWLNTSSMVMPEILKGKRSWFYANPRRDWPSYCLIVSHLNSFRLDSCFYVENILILRYRPFPAAFFDNGLGENVILLSLCISAHVFEGAPLGIDVSHHRVSGSI